MNINTAKNMSMRDLRITRQAKRASIIYSWIYNKTRFKQPGKECFFYFFL